MKIAVTSYPVHVGVASVHSSSSSLPNGFYVYVSRTLIEIEEKDWK